MTLVTLGRVDGGPALFTALIYFVALNAAIASALSLPMTRGMGFGPTAAMDSVAPTELGAVDTDDASAGTRVCGITAGLAAHPASTDSISAAPNANCQESSRHSPPKGRYAHPLMWVAPQAWSLSTHLGCGYSASTVGRPRWLRSAREL